MMNSSEQSQWHSMDVDKVVDWNSLPWPSGYPGFNWYRIGNISNDLD